MRTMFPGHFRPNEEDFQALWADCMFAVDANVLLNLYRYSPDTRAALEGVGRHKHTEDNLCRLMIRLR